MAHAPLLFAVPVPTCVVPSTTVTVLLATAVPVRVGVLSFVVWSPTTPLSVENETIVGAAGGVGDKGVEGDDGTELGYGVGSELLFHWTLLRMVAFELSEM